MKPFAYSHVTPVVFTLSLLSVPISALAIDCPKTGAPPYGVASTTPLSLTFNDEFDGSALKGPLDQKGLDTGKWNNAIWYQTSTGPLNYDVNATVNGKGTGTLRVWPESQNGKFYDRTLDTDKAKGASADTPEKHSQRFGFFEICAKLPYGVGPWPAFWLLSHRDNARPEIDIMEAYPGSRNKGYWSNELNQPIAYGVNAWNDSTSEIESGYIKSDVGPLSESFNVYGVEWTGEMLTFYFNGVPKKTMAAPNTQHPMYILLSFWFGSESGTPHPKKLKSGPANSYEIDYVRAWSR